MSRWIQQAVRRSPLQGQRQIIALTLLGVFMAVVIGALYLSNVADTSTMGRQLEALLQERDRLEQRNEQLRIEISELRSVPRLLSRAEALGFQNAGADEVEYLLVDGYRPPQPINAAVVESVSTPVPTYDETLIGWLQQQYDQLALQFQNYNRLSGE